AHHTYRKRLAHRAYRKRLAKPRGSHTSRKPRASAHRASPHTVRLRKRPANRAALPRLANRAALPRLANRAALPRLAHRASPHSAPLRTARGSASRADHWALLVTLSAVMRRAPLESPFLGVQVPWRRRAPRPPGPGAVRNRMRRCSALEPGDSGRGLEPVAASGAGQGGVGSTAWSRW